MKLSPFMIQVKKGLKKNTKKQLIEKVLIGIEQSAQETLSGDERFDKICSLNEENLMELINTKNQLNSARLRLSIYRNMTIWEFIKSKWLNENPENVKY